MEKEPKFEPSPQEEKIEDLVDESQVESVMEEKDPGTVRDFLEKKKNVLELLDKAVIMKRTRDANPDDPQKEQWHLEAKKAYERAAEDLREEELQLPQDVRMRMSQLETLDDIGKALKNLENNEGEIKKEAA